MLVKQALWGEVLVDFLDEVTRELRIRAPDHGSLLLPAETKGCERYHNHGYRYCHSADIRDRLRPSAKDYSPQWSIR
nr:hypothetical protein CE91St29_03470 [Corynebacterium striatum]